MNKKPDRRFGPVRNILSVLLGIVLIILIAAVVFIGILTVTEYRPSPYDILTPQGTASSRLSDGASFRVMTWNTGYGALGDNSDFFMDGGSMVMTADKARVQENLEGILSEIQNESPDVLFLQEVDRDSSRSRHIDETAFFQSNLDGYQSTFANNYKTLFVPYPLPPLGKVDSGILTLSRYPSSTSERIQLPVPFSWPVSLANLKRCLDIERIPIEDSERELILINLHLEAYDSGEGKIAQTNMLREYMQTERERGNYVIAGGDFNQVFSGVDTSAYPVRDDCWQPGILDEDVLGEGWQYIMDTVVPSCRSLDQPYAGADHEHFQYYLIDGFIVSDNLIVDEYRTIDQKFTFTDHNPVVLDVHLPSESQSDVAETETDSSLAGDPSEDQASSQEEIPQAGILKEAAEKIENKEYDYDFTLGFAGDICLADNYLPMQYLAAIGSTDIADGIDPQYIDLMNGMDLMWINNEFTYSNRGEPLYGKAFTFCADPSNVSYMKDLGVDIVGLANNHTFDFGEDAFIDTLTTLENADIPYVGAGRTLDEAAAPVYIETNGFTIAYVAASCAELEVFTPEATETTPGILACYDNTRFLESIREAAENADYVIALPHWGIEHSTFLQDLQTDGAHAYIDAGADAVIGTHPHILQGIEYYNGKPILYSLGNFWFDNYDIDTMVASLHITGNTTASSPSLDTASVELVVYPGTQTGTYTWLANTPDWKDRILRYLESISVNIRIDEKDIVRESTSENEPDEIENSVTGEEVDL